MAESPYIPKRVYYSGTSYIPMSEIIKARKAKLKASKKAYAQRYRERDNQKRREKKRPPEWFEKTKTVKLTEAQEKEVYRLAGLNCFDPQKSIERRIANKQAELKELQRNLAKYERRGYKYKLSTQLLWRRKIAVLEGVLKVMCDA